MKEMLEAVHVQLLRSCPAFERLLLSALILESRATSRCEPVHRAATGSEAQA
jgi:hypothetical protein